MTARRLWVDFQVQRGALTIAPQFAAPLTPAGVTVLFGPSGCGKTTILRCLAGLDRPDAGVMQWNDQIWFDRVRGIDLPTQQRHIGLLTQDDTLFPHLSAGANVGFGLGRLSPSERRSRVDELLAWVRLPDVHDRRPAQLSAGQRQRVALARAIAPKPELLLLDEPLTALDGPLRTELRLELHRWLKEAGIPAILVTHDLTEALTIGDRMVLMEEGRVLQEGMIEDLLGRPQSSTAARLLGMQTLTSARVEPLGEGLVRLVLETGLVLTAIAPPTPLHSAIVGLRAEDVSLHRGPLVGVDSIRNRLPGRVTGLAPTDAMMRVEVDVGFPIGALVSRPAAAELELAVGVDVTVMFKTTALHLIPRS